jgi:hypothetical protein
MPVRRRTAPYCKSGVEGWYQSSQLLPFLKRTLVTVAITLNTIWSGSLASFHQILQAIVTVLAVINPVVCGSIFLTLTPNLAQAKRRWAAGKVALTILVILVISALIGLKV